MRVVVFSDLHGNLPALEIFVRETKGFDGYVCLGDVVNYGPWSDECLELVRTLPSLTFVEGNHEALYLGTEDLAQEHPLVQKFTEQTLSSFRRYDLIENLPKACVLGDFTFTHTIEHKRVFWDTEIEVDRNYFIGHTHYSFDTRRGDYRIINSGSLGQNRRDISHCSYAIVDLSSNVVELHEFEHDAHIIVSEMESRKYPTECLEYYRKKIRNQLS